MNILQCQGAEMAFAASMKERAEIVRANQQEMADFTEYLIQIFFVNLLTPSLGWDNRTFLTIA
jgi:hypothetical protein